MIHYRSGKVDKSGLGLAFYYFVYNSQIVTVPTSFPPESNKLYFCVREPFISRLSTANLIFGEIPANQQLEIVSEMPQNGTIFSDGIESDYLEFNSGSIAKIGLADKKLVLLV